MTMKTTTKNNPNGGLLIRDHGEYKTVEQYLQYTEPKNCQPRTQYAGKPSFKNENEIKAFSNKVREFSTSRPAV